MAQFAGLNLPWANLSGKRKIWPQKVKGPICRLIDRPVPELLACSEGAGFGKRPGFFPDFFLPLPLTNDIDGVDVVDITDIIDVVDVVDEGCEMI